MLFRALFLSLCLSLIGDDPLPLSFRELYVTWEQIADEVHLHQLIEKFSPWEGKEVVIKGFLYSDPEGHSILASEPNLKTCCLNTFDQHILLDHPIPPPSSTHRISTIQGKFHTQPHRNGSGAIDQLFVLKEATLIDGSTSYLFLLPIVILGLGLLSYIFFFRKKVHRI